MNKYLIEILKNHSSLILPGIGALMVTNKKTGEIKFNPHLTFNDGALASFISTEEGIDKAEAQNKVAKFTSEIKTTVDKGETYDIFEFGTIYKDENGDLAFEMAKASNTKAAQPEKKDEDLKSTPPKKAAVKAKKSAPKTSATNSKTKTTNTDTKKTTSTPKAKPTPPKASNAKKKKVEKEEKTVEKVENETSQAVKKVADKAAKTSVKNTYIPPTDKDKLPEVPKIVSESNTEPVQKESTKETVTVTAEYKERKKRRWWPIIILLLLIGLVIAAYFFRDQIKSYLGWNEKPKVENPNNYPDSDGDGIPDFADVDLTGGADEDGDGIDDLADLDYTHGKDEDGDGIDDAFAESALTALDDVEEIDPLAMADEDEDGIPDYADINLTSGEDSNDNGIDDVFDAAITLGSDLNKDGIDDSLANIALLNHLKNQMEDSDSNGIPDYADVNLTQGEDINKNGIDDAYESVDQDKNGDGLNDSILMALLMNGPDDIDPSSGEETAMTDEEMINEEKEIENDIVEPVTAEENDEIVEAEPEVSPELETNSGKVSSTGYNATGNYHAIGAAFSEKSNAEKYTSTMNGNGFNATIIGRFDGLYLVSLKQYSSMSEAKSNLSEIRNRSSSSSAWIFKH